MLKHSGIQPPDPELYDLLPGNFRRRIDVQLERVIDDQLGDLQISVREQIRQEAEWTR